MASSGPVKQDIPPALKHLIVWLLIGTAVFLGVQAWQAQARKPRIALLEGGRIELQRSPDGHFHWPGRVNGIAVDFLVDTGATHTALPQALAERAGLVAEGRVRGMTAGGEVQGYMARAELQLDGGVRADRLPVMVLPELQAPLLGMDVLSKMRFTQTGGVLRIDAS